MTTRSTKRKTEMTDEEAVAAAEGAAGNNSYIQETCNAALLAASQGVEPTAVVPPTAAGVASDMNDNKNNEMLYNNPMMEGVEPTPVLFAKRSKHNNNDNNSFNNEDDSKQPALPLTAGTAVYPFPAHLDPNDHNNFDHFLFQLLSFRATYGHFHINRDRHPQLHTWVGLLKRDYKTYADNDDKANSSSKLTEQQVKVLESLHVPLTSRGDDHWNRFYDLLREYKQRHGHCLVPRLCEIPGLGDWVRRCISVCLCVCERLWSETFGKQNRLTD